MTWSIASYLAKGFWACTDKLEIDSNFCSFLFWNSISTFSFRDVVKLTAQFVAKNGKSFLQTLIQKEQKNYLFDFLRPQHGHFQYFTKLVEQYSKVC